mmetsp:Transcript_13518/g.37431  ORF Transcript_13518/g.37431 Transcript_13518/m.37431 type:complete len:365 (-) Transcript_13518:888-1982(-)
MGRVFAGQPDLLCHFSKDDVDGVGGSLLECVALMLAPGSSREATLATLRALGKEAVRIKLPVWAYPCILKSLLDLVVEELPGAGGPAVLPSVAALFDVLAGVASYPQWLVERVSREADDFFEQAAPHFGWSAQALAQRKLRALREIYATGTHELSEAELCFGAQLAWRNSGKCSGRIAWNTLLVRDLRVVEDPELMYHEMVEHQRLATAGPSLRSVMTVFRARRPGEAWGPRVWNAQYVRFACWEMEDGTLLGDAANRELTAAIQRHFPAWKPPAVKTAFDVLPLVVEVPGQGPPRLFELPPEATPLVPITHPDNERVAGLGWRWCAVPTITNFNLRVAGVDFGCCPFNGWFLDLEVARNLLDR